MTERVWQLSDGRTVALAAATPADAEDLLQHCLVVGAETDFLTFGPEGIGLSVDAERAFLGGVRERGELFLVARVDGVLAGALNLIRGRRERVTHNVELGITVQRRYWRLGIGRALIDAALAWAPAHGVTRVSLRVREDNARAIALYERLGFRHEGRAERATRVGDAYFGELAMAWLADGAGASRARSQDTTLG